MQELRGLEGWWLRFHHQRYSGAGVMGGFKVIHVDWEPRAAILAMEQMKPLEELAYRRILDLIYIYGNKLLDDDKELARMTKTFNRWPTIKERLLNLHHCIYLKDGFLKNKKCDEKCAAIERYIAQKSVAGKASAEKRKANKNKGVGSTGVGTATPTADQHTHLPIYPKKKEGYLTVSQESQFDDWWSIFPKKVGKGAAERKFKIALKITDFETLKAGAVRYAREASDKEPQFIVSPARWLHEKRWLDEPERKPHGNQHRGNGAERPSAHDTMLAAHAFAATSRPDAGTGEDIPPDGRGKEDTGKPAARVPRLPSARRAD